MLQCGRLLHRTFCFTLHTVCCSASVQPSRTDTISTNPAEFPTLHLRVNVKPMEKALCRPGTTANTACGTFSYRSRWRLVGVTCGRSDTTDFDIHAKINRPDVCILRSNSCYISIAKTDSPSYQETNNRSRRSSRRRSSSSSRSNDSNN